MVYDMMWYDVVIFYGNVGTYIIIWSVLIYRIADHNIMARYYNIQDT